MHIHPHIFKAYDVRGIYPAEINAEIISVITTSLQQLWGSGKIVVGHDARLSSPELYKAALATFRRRGSKFSVIEGGLMTTPMLYFLVGHLKAKGGMMITASHSPRKWNGIKAVSKGVVPISGEDLKKLVL